jgi:hypothetical protein
MKAKAVLIFMGYIESSEGQLVKVGKPHDDVDSSQLPRLSLTGFENGLSTGVEVSGDIVLGKEQLHDLLNGEGLGGRAVFAVKIVD